MKHSSLDRRKAKEHPVFPLIDIEGHEVKGYRRSGKDRRKDKRDLDIASHILNFLH